MIEPAYTLNISLPFCAATMVLLIPFLFFVGAMIKSSERLAKVVNILVMGLLLSVTAFLFSLSYVQGYWLYVAFFVPFATTLLLALRSFRTS